MAEFVSKYTGADHLGGASVSVGVIGPLRHDDVFVYLHELAGMARPGVVGDEGAAPGIPRQLKAVRPDVAGALFRTLAGVDHPQHIHIAVVVLVVAGGRKADEGVGVGQHLPDEFVGVLGGAVVGAAIDRVISCRIVAAAPGVNASGTAHGVVGHVPVIIVDRSYPAGGAEQHGLKLALGVGAGQIGEIAHHHRVTAAAADLGRGILGPQLLDQAVPRTVQSFQPQGRQRSRLCHPGTRGHGPGRGCQHGPQNQAE
jgi:hypothetical protein